MSKKWLNVICFFRANLTINFAISIIVLLFGDLIKFSICFLFFGYFTSLFFRELYTNKKREYLFYYNNGITKLELIIYCFLLNLCFVILINLIAITCQNIF